MSDDFRYTAKTVLLFLAEVAFLTIAFYTVFILLGVVFGCMIGGLG